LASKALNAVLVVGSAILVVGGMTAGEGGGGDGGNGVLSGQAVKIDPSTNTKTVRTNDMFIGVLL
jgi:hypothetical protein